MSAIRQEASDRRAGSTLKSSQLARLAGVSTDTLRHYERKGLLTPRRAANGYREYPPQALGRVRMIQRALSVGFTLEELARVQRIRNCGGMPCRQVRALAEAKLQSMEAQIRDLGLLRDELKSLLRRWDAWLVETPKGKPARLLDRWSDAVDAAGPSPPSPPPTPGPKKRPRRKSSS